MNNRVRTIVNDRPQREGFPTARGGIRFAGGADYNVRVVRTVEQFDDLGECWNGLLEHADATVFQSYEWQRTWWKYFGDGLDLKILLFERGGKTEGIVPLCLARVKLLGVPVARHLKFLGGGLSDYLSPVILRGREAAVTGALARYLATHRREWDTFDLEDVNEHSACLGLLPAALDREGLPLYRYQGSVCPAIELPESMDELMHSLSSSASYNLKRKTKRLESNFTSEIELIRDESDDLAGAIADFAAIHGDRWKSQGHPSAFDDERHRAFHIDIAVAFARKDWLRIYFLKVDGKRVAVNFSFAYRSVNYMYQSNAHGPEDVMKCSPGLLVTAASIRGAISGGMRSYDFMRGNETYKYREWDAVDSKNWLIRSSSTTVGGRVRFYFFLWAELFSKIRNRTRREWYDYRRFRITGRGRSSRWKYLGEKTAGLIGMYLQFLKRHIRRQNTSGPKP